MNRGHYSSMKKHVLFPVENVDIYFIAVKPFFYEYKFTVGNKKTKKDIHQAPRHLRMPGTNLKTIKFNNI